MPNLGGAVCTGTGGAVSTGRGGAESSEFSYDGGIVWEAAQIYIHVKGQTPEFSAGEGAKCPPNTMGRTATVVIPIEGLQFGKIQLHDNDDLERIKANPDLLWKVTEALPWSEPFKFDELDWSDWCYSGVK